MNRAEARLAWRDLVLPPGRLPAAVTIPFPWARVRGQRAFCPGHGAFPPDGTPLGPFGPDR